jgi:hypothetical protein
MFIRDRLLWIHNDDPCLVSRLNEIIHAAPPDGPRVASL